MHKAILPSAEGNIWQQHLYVNLLEEVHPFDEPHRFRSLNQAYSGENTFWSAPSPEPDLDDDFWHTVAVEIDNEQIREAAQRLAAAIIQWEPQPERLLFAAILRAGVPIAQWLCTMLPGSVAAALSLFVGIGIDRVALSRLQADFPERKIIFVDGWTGRGGVARELARLGAGPLAVLNDPWGWADFSGCQEDIFCPSACFTGLATLGFSRTFFIDEQSFFAAYTFPERYVRKDLVATWYQSGPSRPAAFPLGGGEKFYQKTELRLHSNEVCRALINALPSTLFFVDDAQYVREHFSLLLTLADQRKVPVQYNQQFLRNYRTRAACSLHIAG
ncbi:MAG: Phosphoribosyl transferase (PRTase) [Candidatus Electronema aureum]|uniref:Phosphoribosyl transferase (PRTase) n=1 Tax=Candidatus Electronema aureum TaxID=2005002 RepID=A0A521G2V4_9BACT|nr:MAG: Phosphoribosyl transferase (PRTase) [Candidatus Electronema aureum]